MSSSQTPTSLIAFAVGSSAALATSLYLLNQRHDEVTRLEEENCRIREQNKTLEGGEGGKLKGYALLLREEGSGR